MADQAGYSALAARFGLRIAPLARVAVLDSSIKGRKTRMQGGQLVALFEPKYRPDDDLCGHLQFALRYEGVNLLVLSLLFAQTGAEEIKQWLESRSESAYARRAAFLYEWLTDSTLSMDDPVSARSRYVPVADEGLQWVNKSGARQNRFRIINNLPGPREFCPLIYRTAFIREQQEKNLREMTRDTIGKYDEGLIRRAAAFLYLKETQSSFEVEREKSFPQKSQRFADMLRQADSMQPLSEERLVALQQVVIDPRFHEFTWRRKQNWIGKNYGYCRQIDFVPARPEDVPSLMNGLLAMAANLVPLEENGEEWDDADSVMMAAAVSFGFVYIHPFMDGNGRIHRYLIHDVLAKAGFTPKGIVLPVSAVILANLDEYINTLEQFSRPLNGLTEYDPDMPDAPAKGNDGVYFQYPDLTAQCEFLYKALERTVTRDLEEEIRFLLGFDRASQALSVMLDWPGHTLDLFIRVVRENNGKLSGIKRRSHFDWMGDDEISEAEALVREAFNGTV